jgi:hypothetical protein
MELIDVVTNSYRHSDMVDTAETITNGHGTPLVKSNGDVSIRSEPLPIVIAGGGCVGLFLALLLCQSDISNKVIVRS